MDKFIKKTLILVILVLPKIVPASDGALTDQSGSGEGLPQQQVFVTTIGGEQIPLDDPKSTLLDLAKAFKGFGVRFYVDGNKIDPRRTVGELKAQYPDNSQINVTAVKGEDMLDMLRCVYGEETLYLGEASPEHTIKEVREQVASRLPQGSVFQLKAPDDTSLMGKMTVAEYLRKYPTDPIKIVNAVRICFYNNKQKTSCIFHEDTTFGSILAKMHSEANRVYVCELRDQHGQELPPNVTLREHFDANPESRDGFMIRAVQYDTYLSLNNAILKKVTGRECRPNMTHKKSAEFTYAPQTPQDEKRFAQLLSLDWARELYVQLEALRISYINITPSTGIAESMVDFTVSPARLDHVTNEPVEQLFTITAPRDLCSVEDVIKAKVFKAEDGSFKVEIEGGGLLPSRPFVPDPQRISRNWQ